MEITPFVASFLLWFVTYFAAFGMTILGAILLAWLIANHPAVFLLAFITLVAAVCARHRAELEN